jgi:hypothetical protein
VLELVVARDIRGDGWRHERNRFLWRHRRTDAVDDGQRRTGHLR